MADLTDTIETAAAGARRASGDMGSFEQHSLQDLIEADRYLKGLDAASKAHQGLRFVQLSPPGTA